MHAKKVFVLERWIFLPCYQDDPSFKRHWPQGRSLHETKDTYVETPSTTHGASCIEMFDNFNYFLENSSGDIHTWKRLRIRWAFGVTEAIIIGIMFST